jgi:hypothetical protein
VLGGWSWAMVWPGLLSDFSCTRYLHHGGRDDWESSSVRSDKLGSGLLGALDWRPDGEESSTPLSFCRQGRNSVSEAYKLRARGGYRSLRPRPSTWAA